MTPSITCQWPLSPSGTCQPLKSRPLKRETKPSGSWLSAAWPETADRPAIESTSTASSRANRSGEISRALTNSRTRGRSRSPESNASAVAGISSRARAVATVARATDPDSPSATSHDVTVGASSHSNERSWSMVPTRRHIAASSRLRARRSIRHASSRSASDNHTGSGSRTLRSTPGTSVRASIQTTYEPEVTQTPAAGTSAAKHRPAAMSARGSTWKSGAPRGMIMNSWMSTLLSAC